LIEFELIDSISFY